MYFDDMKLQSELWRKQQAIKERNAKDAYGIEVVRDAIPNGGLCNPSVTNWCEHLHCDWCEKYKTHLWTKHGIGGEFHAQKKSPRCLKAYPHGKSNQIALFDDYCRRRTGMTDNEKKALVDIFIVSLVALARPLLLPVVIQNFDDEKGGEKE